MRSSLIFRRVSILLTCLFVLLPGAPAFALLPATNYTVTFYENDTPTDSVSTFAFSSSPTDLTLFSDLSPAFSNPGYTFAGWNIYMNGSGTSYSDGASYSYNADLRLYAQWNLIPVSHTVTFAENDSAGDAITSNESRFSATGLTSFAALNPSFSNPGYTFAGWNTQLNGGGASYSDGATYSFLTNVELYAQWVAIPSSTATFASNGGVGSVSSLAEAVGASVMIPSGAGLSKSGFTFSGWNTAADGSGTPYVVGASYVLNADQTFYAQWTANPSITVQPTTNQFTVTFAQMGGFVTPSSDNYVMGGPAISLPLPTLPGSSFNGWFTMPAGGVLVGLAGSTYIPSTSITLYATWSAVSSIDLSFDGNGASSSVASLSGTSGTTFALPGSSSIARSGFSLTSWNTAADGSGTSYSPGQDVTPSIAMTLYAQWSPVAMTSIEFNTDGGSGSLSTLNASSGSLVTLPGASNLVKPGYTLKSWNTSANGSGTTYELGQSVTASTALTLYAQWKGSLTPVLFGAVGRFAKDSSELNAAMKAQVHKLAVSVKAQKVKKVTLYGYTASTGLASLDLSLSRRRADAVATYLRTQFRALKVSGVTVRAAGEGSIKGKTSSLYSRVEVFVL